MDRNKFDDFISSIWMKLGMQEWKFDNNRNEHEKEINLQ